MAFPYRIPASGIPSYPAFGVNMVPMQMQQFYLPGPTPSPLLLSGAPRGLPRKPGPGDAPPVTTVFVGNIHDRCTNDLIRAMLQELGNVVSWKRIQGSSGKYQAFGFCELEHPESTLRALRVLHDFPLGDKRLVVKVDEKTRELLKAFVDRTRKEQGKADLQTEGDALPCDPGWTAEDGQYTDAIRLLVKTQGDNLDPVETTKTESRKSPTLHGKGGNLDIASLDREKKEYIAREISNFRDQHKDEEEEEKDKDRKTKRRRRSRSTEAAGTPTAAPRPQPRRTSPQRRRSRSRDSERRRRDRRRETGRRSSRERRARRTRSPSASSASSASRSRSRSRSTRSSRSSRSKSRSRSRRTSVRHREVRRPRTPTRSRSPEPIESEDEEDRREREKLERRLREKEEAYQSRLKKWEKRERLRAKEYERFREKAATVRREEAREAKKLKEFLEDYDDERDDPKYYKSGSLFQRRREYEKERQEDAKDRQKEKEEVEELRKKLTADGCEDPEAEMARLAAEAEEKLLRKLRADSDEPPTPRRRAREQAEEAKAAKKQRKAEAKEDGEESSSSDEDDSDAEDSDPGGWGKDLIEDDSKAASITGTPSSAVAGPSTNGVETPSEVPAAAPAASPVAVAPEKNSGFIQVVGPRIGFQGLKLGSKVLGGGDGGAAAAQSLAARIAAFGEAEEEEPDCPLTGKKLNFSVTAEERRANLTPEERKKMTKTLIERIPTGKAELFAFPIDWAHVDDTLISKRVRPWVNKKILEYIGEEEPSLVDFICAKVRDHSGPATILEDIKMVLDEEADVFVVKMWRLLIYEVEAKKLGIVGKD